MHRLGIFVEHGFGLAEVLRRTALDHIGCQGPRASGKADQRYAAVKLAANGAYRVHHVAQVFLRIRNGQRLDVGHVADDLLEPWPFACLEIQPKTHGVRHGEDVGEQDRRIQRVALKRLKGDFTGQFGIHAQAHEVARLAAAGPVLREVAPGLSHHPHRGDVDRLLEQGAEKAIILQGSHVWVPAKKWRHCRKAQNKRHGERRAFYL